MMKTIDSELLRRAVGRLPADALMPQRKEALQRFDETGFPTTRHEDWKYTNLAPAIEISNKWLRDAEDVEPPVSEAVMQYARELASVVDAHWLVVANGVFRGVLRQGELTRGQDFSQPGITVASLAAADMARLLAPADPLTRFNTALLRDALQVTVAAGYDGEKPLGLLVADDSGNSPAVSQVRVMIDVGASSRVSIIEQHASFGKHEQFANVVNELTLAHSAHVDYLRLQDRDRAHVQVGRLNARLARDASLRHSAFDLGGGLVRNDVAVEIAEPGAHAELSGLYLADGQQHIDNHTRVDHRVGPASSSEEYRGILADRARCVFNGKALVHPGADGTNAQQANHNLLLSDKAEIDTKPELEIYADDVKCSHGATVGQLDKAALFYLRSRGLDRVEATRVMTRAFAAGIVGKVTVVEARAHVESLVERRLQDLAGGLFS